MSKKSLTIVISDIPERYLNGVWKDAIKLAKTEMGFKLERSDTFKVDFHTVLESEENVLSSLITSAIIAYAIQYFDNKYNPIPK